MSKTRSKPSNGKYGFPGLIPDEVYERAFQRVRRMTPRQRRKLLIETGILTPDGELAPMYRSS